MFIGCKEILPVSKARIHPEYVAANHHDLGVTITIFDRTERHCVNLCHIIIFDDFLVGSL
jgi:hypothetical protein